ncbi:hypothetical protein LX15_001175 [Streptoalloteichus tenebrarius]|uniref:Uncharacterized protein n=1 Tax=Streptoalloteichus tenebrarius (strain ATCC 17920 / DSM 40477 / JCM 4838 / CBS 697.72 / NBRC 16177 / NCIMB 11028 / NRRL B-12390 / A12253. 1 / ISP 5477) TaxID=1933 RepID=A0ABT1HPQ5_STRSD|nr:hypothetical protein [Streptoalloteichus tenebrarius]MCP2257490.1 hypothetical protein [Streptoalloteichus tenebrarius]BFE98439.1 hypothetical protein GCM10020241_01150 [Streptoalloteichus tenebrarius]
MEPAVRELHDMESLIEALEVRVQEVALHHPTGATQTQGCSLISCGGGRVEDGD